MWMSTVMRCGQLSRMKSAPVVGTIIRRRSEDLIATTEQIGGRQSPRRYVLTRPDAPICRLPTAPKGHHITPIPPPPKLFYAFPRPLPTPGGQEGCRRRLHFMRPFRPLFRLGGRWSASIAIETVSLIANSLQPEHPTRAWPVELTRSSPAVWCQHGWHFFARLPT